MFRANGAMICSTLRRQEDLIKNIIAEISKAKEGAEKADFATQLQKEVNILLSCRSYDEKNMNCSNCHFIASVRKKMADLVIMSVKKLV